MKNDIKKIQYYILQYIYIYYDTWNENAVLIVRIGIKQSSLNRTCLVISVKVNYIPKSKTVITCNIVHCVLIIIL